MPLHRALFLLNRHSRQGHAAALDAAAERLRAGGMTLRIETPDDPRVLPALVRAYCDSVDLVIVAGGDGTLNTVADVMVESGLPLGVLPLGTANDLARTLTIPTALPEACEAILAGATTRIDMGWVNGKHFFNVASIGLSVGVTRALTPEFKRRWGILGYPLAAFRVLRAVRPFHAEIECDGQIHLVKAVQIAVGNGRHYGGGMTIADDAAIDDARLDLYSLPPHRLWEYLALLPALRSGRYAGWPGLVTLRGRDITVRTRRQRSINTDGEVTRRTPAHFRVLPRILRVVVPERYLLQRQGGGNAA